MILHDAVDNGQAEPGTFADWLCGKKRVEEMGADLVTHAHPGILDGQTDIRPRPGIGMFSTILLIDVHVLGANDQLASLWHGIAGIDGQVEHDLIQIAGVSPDRPQGIGQHKSDLNILAEQPLEHPLQAAEVVVPIDDLPGERLLSAKEQQLLREMGGLVGSQLDFLEIGLYRGRDLLGE